MLKSFSSCSGSISRWALWLVVAMSMTQAGCDSDPEEPDSEQSVGDEIEESADEAADDVDEAVDEAEDEVDEEF